jgi:hypothetical protein
VSGLDKKSFCNSQGISYGRFLYWCKRLAESSSAAPSVPSLARLEVISTQCKHQTINLRQKKHLFAGSLDAAQRAAIFYSLFTTCKLHGVNPYD